MHWKKVCVDGPMRSCERFNIVGRGEAEVGQRNYWGGDSTTYDTSAAYQRDDLRQ